MRRLRKGVTLVELVVAMAIGGLVLALVAGISVRQQRLHADIADRMALAEQLRQASTVLPIELRGISPNAGDLRDARDTAVEFRSTIASVVVCDTISGGVLLAPVDAGDSTYAGVLTPIVVGDTAWMLATGDSSDRWTPYAVAAVGTATGRACDRAGPLLSAAARTKTRISLQLTPPPPPAAIGSVLRATRPTRYSLYRGGDGNWYLGARDWNVGTSRFNTTQPVSGPFSSASAGGLEFRYFDSSGAELARPVARPQDVALIRIAIRGQTRDVMRAFSNAHGRAGDSSIVAVAIRNRP